MTVLDQDLSAEVGAELASFTATVRGLTSEQWAAPTLCSGWTVRDVVAHVVVGFVVPTPTLGGWIDEAGGDILAMTAQRCAEYAAERSDADLLRELTALPRPSESPGIVAGMASAELLHDVSVHHLDIARPLGLPAGASGAALVDLLQLSTEYDGLTGASGRAASLRLVAADVDWSWGEGPEVRGPGQDLVLALAGRPAGLRPLTGPGVSVLRDRMPLHTAGA
jgi:uncharacterized protein (TIGR03083 family)